MECERRPEDSVLDAMVIALVLEARGVARSEDCARGKDGEFETAEGIRSWALDEQGGAP